MSENTVRSNAVSYTEMVHSYSLYYVTKCINLNILSLYEKFRSTLFIKDLEKFPCYISDFTQLRASLATF